MPITPGHYLPRGNRHLSELLRVHSAEDGVVTFAPANGGFQSRLPEKGFARSFSAASDEEVARLSRDHVEAWFDGDWFDDQDPVKGLHNGKAWNGWATPLFAKDEVLAAVSDGRIPGADGSTCYLDDRDAFLVVATDDGSPVPPEAVTRAKEALGDGDTAGFTLGEGEEATSVRGTLLRGEDVEVTNVGTVRAYDFGALGWCWSKAEQPSPSPSP